jgi:hypothetical protein
LAHVEVYRHLNLDSGPPSIPTICKMVLTEAAHMVEVSELDQKLADEVHHAINTKLVDYACEDRMSSAVAVLIRCVLVYAASSTTVHALSSVHARQRHTHVCGPFHMLSASSRTLLLW